MVKGPGHGEGALPYPSNSQGSPSKDSSPARLSPGLISAALGLLPTAFPHAFRPVASRWGGPLPGNRVAGALGGCGHAPGAGWWEVEARAGVPGPGSATLVPPAPLLGQPRFAVPS